MRMSELEWGVIGTMVLLILFLVREIKLDLEQRDDKEDKDT